MIRAPAAPSASFAPVRSGCQQLLNSVSIREIDSSFRTSDKSSAERSFSPPSTIAAAPSEPWATTTLQPAPRTTNRASPSVVISRVADAAGWLTTAARGRQTRRLRPRPREESFYDRIRASCRLPPFLDPLLRRASYLSRALDLDDFRTAAQTPDGNVPRSNAASMKSTGSSGPWAQSADQLGSAFMPCSGRRMVPCGVRRGNGAATTAGFVPTRLALIAATHRRRYRRSGRAGHRRSAAAGHCVGRWPRTRPAPTKDRWHPRRRCALSVCALP